MSLREYEQPTIDTRAARLYELAELVLDSPEVCARYTTAKLELLGNADPERRREGEHPWPTRMRGQECDRVFSVPMLAGVSPERGTLLYIGKDPWHDGSDAYLARVINLQTGYSFDHTVLDVSVEPDNNNRIWVNLARQGTEHWPPQLRDSLINQPRHAQLAVEGYLDDAYHIETAVVHDAMKDTAYEDFSMLESMIRVVQQEREARLAGVRELVSARAVTAAMAGL